MITEQINLTSDFGYCIHLPINTTELVKIIEFGFLFLIEHHYGRNIKSMRYIGIE